MGGLDSFLGVIADLLAEAGIDVSVGLLRVVALIIIALIVVQLAVVVVKTTRSASVATVGFARQQIEGKFWRDAGKLATVVSLVLLVLAYGLFGDRQPRSLGDELLALGQERLAEIIPLAIVTQALLLVVFWFVFGRITNVSVGKLFEPFRLLAMFAAAIAVAGVVSTGVFAATGASVENALVATGVIMMVGLGFVALASRVLRTSTVATASTGPGTAASGPPVAGARSAGAPSPPAPSVGAALSLAGAGVLLIFALLGAVLTVIYTAINDDESTMSGLLGFDVIALSVVVLLACFRFRAYMGSAKVPPALPYFIDFCLALSACAIAVAGLATVDLRLDPLPAWLLAVGPPVFIAIVVFVANLLRLRPVTTHWSLCLAVAVIGGLLVGPAKAVLAAALAPVLGDWPFSD